MNIFFIFQLFFKHFLEFYMFRVIAESIFTLLCLNEFIQLLFHTFSCIF